MTDVSRENMEKYRAVFNQCDADGDRLICLRELDAFINSHRGRRSQLPIDAIRDIHSMADKDGNKKLNFDEFVDLIEHPDLQHLVSRWMHSYINFIIPRAKPPPRPPPTPVVRPVGRRALVRPVSALPVAEVQSFLVQPKAQEEEIEEPLLLDESQYYIDQFSCCPPPISMLIISIFELTFFLIDEFTQKDSTLSGSGITAQIFIYDPTKRHEFWRYLTYMFVHIGCFHLIVNLVVQVLLGIPLEMVHKWWRVLVIYLAGVVAGSLATSITDPYVRLAGASGGVYALLTAHMATIIMNWSEMAFPAIQLFVFGLISSCDIGSSIYDRYFLNDVNQIGFAAHFGGAVAGLLVGIYILRNLHVTTFEKYIWWIAVVLYVLMMGIAVVLNVVLKGHFPT